MLARAVGGEGERLVHPPGESLAGVVVDEGRTASAAEADLELFGGRAGSDVCSAPRPVEADLVSLTSGQAVDRLRESAIDSGSASRPRKLPPAGLVAGRPLLDAVARPPEPENRRAASVRGVVVIRAGRVRGPGGEEQVPCCGADGVDGGRRPACDRAVCEVAVGVAGDGTGRVHLEVAVHHEVRSRQGVARVPPRPRASAETAIGTRNLLFISVPCCILESNFPLPTTANSGRALCCTRGIEAGAATGRDYTRRVPDETFAPRSQIATFCRSLQG